MTPRSERIALQIYAYCTPLGWDVTTFELAEATGEPILTIRAILKAKGWNLRVRRVVGSLGRERQTSRPAFVDTLLEEFE